MKEAFDFIVIGGGSAGYAAAATAARLGLATAVIEGADDVGGLCILRGCMPSKTLLESAYRAESVRRAAEFGLRAEFHGPDGDAILARKKRLVAEFADYRRSQLEAGLFEFVRGRAAFIDVNTIEVRLREGGVHRLRAKAFLIATGSRVNRIEIPGMDDTGVWDSDEVLAAAHIPKSLIVLGGGAIGLEFASYYAGIGSRVEVLQRGPQLLKEVDVEVAEALAEALERRGMRVWRKTAIIKLERSNAMKRVIFAHGGDRKTVEAEEIIYALGRTPLIEGLQLDRIGVAIESNAVRVNPHQQTSQPHIFAAGDVCGPFEVVHLAIQQGEIAARNAAQLIREEKNEPLEAIDYTLKVFAVFTHPEVAFVGLTEREAMEANVPCLTAAYPFSDHGKALVRGETDGFVKLIAARDSRRILGGAAIGPEASELIHEISVAMYFGATAADLARIPHYHPTLSEIWTYPAEELARL
jgi:pyruvate/2-oxoglutarate dehydrogenase complex dihydrolipoamide dehydrogenase (E3) component